jgi:DNA-binding transcriptional LysR family regulator
MDGKHLLDRLLLPRFLDWWAARNANRALRRAERVLRHYGWDILTVIDVRFLLNRIFTFIIAAIAGLGITLSGFFLAQAWLPTASSELQYNVLMYYCGIAGPLYFTYIWLDTRRRTGRWAGIYAFPDAYRQNVVARLTRLLEAAGLNEAETKSWLEQMPQAPQSRVPDELRDLLEKSQSAWPFWN